MLYGGDGGVYQSSDRDGKTNGERKQVRSEPVIGLIG